MFLPLSFSVALILLFTTSTFPLSRNVIHLYVKVSGECLKCKKQTVSVQSSTGLKKGGCGGCVLVEIPRRNSAPSAHTFTHFPINP